MISKPNLWTVIYVFCVISATGCGNQANRKTPTYRGDVVQRFPHDADAFTQGLAFHENKIVEGTGQYGKSKLRIVEIDSGTVLQDVSLDQQFFGEGITILGGKVYQLTWKNNTCLVYNLATLEFEQSFKYIYEGWGLTDNEKELVLSDGSFKIRFLDPSNFKEIRSVEVVDKGMRVKNINELEWVEDEIWANIWYEDRIARISPITGKVLGWIDLSHVYTTTKRDKENVMNGIAYDPRTKRIFITGKNWPSLFEIKVSTSR
ncbi:MAG: glutaminyl-peptide cyclotransferase [Pirellula sp.]